MTVGTAASPVSAADAAILTVDGVDLLAWAAAAAGGAATRAERTSGGNRCEGWRVDVAVPGAGMRELFLRFMPKPPPGIEPYNVRREAAVYAALSGSDVPAPDLVALHPELYAMLTVRAPGRAEFRRLKDDTEKAAIARDCMRALAALHRLDAARLGIAALGPVGSVTDAVRAELDLWRALYHETGTADPLIEFGFAWLDANLPQVADQAVLVHGDAGPGNFLFEHGRMTALLDWELSHLGDPMEDLAWFTMRCVMEPVPDVPARIRDYEDAAGIEVDLQRIRYHRAFVSLRIVIIRHRNVTGEPGNSVVSRGLNRRLVIDAIAEASGQPVPAIDRVPDPPGARTDFYDYLLDAMSAIAARSDDGQVVARAKNAAKMTKYLREVDRIGDTVTRREHAALEVLLGRSVASQAEGDALLVEALRAGAIPPAEALAYFAQSVAMGEQLAAGAMGGLAYRHYPDLR
jgi:aminoglycoside phosphotransferase (APT) family kinase protein